MHPLSGRPGRAPARRIIPVLATAVVAIMMAAPAFPGGTEAGVPLQASEGVRLEGPRRVVVRDLPSAASGAASPARDVGLPRRLLARAAAEADAGAPPANVLDASPSLEAASPPSPSGAGFEGLDNNDNGTVSGFIVTPPDPQLAVGPSHVFEMVNIIGRIYTRTGGVVQTFTLASFFGVPAGFSDTDPKIIYDAISARWFASYVSLVDNGGSNNDQGRLHIAVSQTNDPTGSWNRYDVIYAKVFPDYAGIGLTNDKFTVSSNIFDIDGPPQPVTPGCSSGGYCGEQTIVFEKADLLAGAPAPLVCGPSANVGACFLPASGPPFNTGRFTVRPAHSLSPANDQYLTTFDVSTVNQLTLIRVTGTPDPGLVSRWRPIDGLWSLGV